MDKRKYKSETNLFSESQGLCPCCNFVQPKATYYRHLFNLESALNSEESLQPNMSDYSPSDSENPPKSDINFNESDYESDKNVET
jgi:hypothetical protein